MKGKHKVIVSTKRLKYEFELRRNLTIIYEEEIESSILTGCD